MKFRDLTGLKFGRLTVLFQAETTSRTRWFCRCECGNTSTVFGNALMQGLSKSCGCLKSELVSTLSKRVLTTHGQSHSPEYAAWAIAKQRCLNQNDKDYQKYGGRGIRMCSQWQDSFEAFLAHIGPKPKRTFLDRINNDGHYEPGNVRWATPKVSAANRRTKHAPDGKFVSTAGRSHDYRR